MIEKAKAEQLPISLSKIDVYIGNYMEFIYTLNEVNKHTMRKERRLTRAGCNVKTCLFVQRRESRGVIISSETF